jgi:hypothetical protein
MNVTPAKPGAADEDNYQLCANNGHIMHTHEPFNECTCGRPSVGAVRGQETRAQRRRETRAQRRRETRAQRSREPRAQLDEVPEIYQVVIECRHEREQQAVFERMRGEGYRCRVLTL